MVKNFKKNAKKENEILDMNEKLLLWNNLIKRNNIYQKNNKVKKLIIYTLAFSKIIPILILYKFFLR